MNGSIEVISFNERGEKICCNIVGAKLHGKCTRTYKGVLTRSINYWQGKKDGKSEEWTREGVPVKSTSFKKGRKHGLCSVFHLNGAIAHQTTLVASSRGKKISVPDGALVTFYDNGVISHRVVYVDGKKEGFENLYHKNGIIMCQYYYIGGILEGHSYEYDINGKLIVVRLHENGIQV